MSHRAVARPAITTWTIDHRSAAHAIRGGPESAALAAPRRGLDRRRSVILGLVGLVTLGVIFIRVIPQIGSYSDAATVLARKTKFR